MTAMTRAECERLGILADLATVYADLPVPQAPDVRSLDELAPINPHASPALTVAQVALAVAALVAGLF